MFIIKILNAVKMEPLIFRELLLVIFLQMKIENTAA